MSSSASVYPGLPSAQGSLEHRELPGAQRPVLLGFLCSLDDSCLVQGEGQGKHFQIWPLGECSCFEMPRGSAVLGKGSGQAEGSLWLLSAI